jgi:two-component sensor histidine kinase
MSVTSAPVPVAAASLDLQPTSGAVSEARRAVDRLLAGRSDDQVAFDLRLVASELVTNAVLYGPPDEPIELELQLHPDWVDLTVRNGGKRLQITNLRSRRRTAGRGLEIVDMLVASWTIEAGPCGTAVSVRLSLG